MAQLRRRWKSWVQRQARAAAAIAAGAPVVPGTTEALKSLREARATADKFGYPVMLKASAGGGGKGMRQVANESELRRHSKPRSQKRVGFW